MKSKVSTPLGCGGLLWTLTNYTHTQAQPPLTLAAPSLLISVPARLLFMVAKVHRPPAAINSKISITSEGPLRNSALKGGRRLCGHDNANSPVAMATSATDLLSVGVMGMGFIHPGIPVILA